jgi:hypothetical protein
VEKEDDEKEEEKECIIIVVFVVVIVVHNVHHDAVSSSSCTAWMKECEQSVGKVRGRKRLVIRISVSAVVWRY